MSEPFNPYLEWLNLSLDRPPASHYELLGLTPVESDLEKIAQVADLQIARIRSVRPGQNLAQWQQLLDELSDAKACLTDPNRKASYDAALSTGETVMRPSKQTIKRAPPPWVHATPTSSDPSNSDKSTESPRHAKLPQAWDEIKTFSKSPPTASKPVIPPTGSIDSPPITTPIPVPDTSFPPSGSETDPSAFVAQANDLPQPSEVEIPTSTPIRRVKRSHATLAALASRAFVLALFGVLVFLLYTLYQRHQQLAASQKTSGHPVVETPSGKEDGDQTKGTPENTASQSTSDVSPSRQTSTQPASSNIQNLDESQKIEPKVSVLIEEDSKSPADPRRQADFREAVSDVRFALSEHDIESARAFLKTAATNVQTANERNALDRLELITDHLTEFWRGMSRAVAGLQATETIKINDTYIAVVESSESHLIVKASGRLRQFSLKEIPSSLVRVLADLRLGKDPATRALLGVYLAVDPDGDQEEARRLWQQAAIDGIDVRDLLAEFDSQSTEPSRLSVPSEAVLRPKLEQIRQQFQKRYRLANSLTGKEELGARLLGSARAIRDQPDLRFAMLREAHDMAIASGRPTIACDVVDELAKSHAINALAMKINAMQKISKTARGLTPHRNIVQQIIPLIEDSIKAERIEESRQLVDIAIISAKKSLNRQRMQQVMAFDQQVTAMEKGSY